MILSIFLLVILFLFLSMASASAEEKPSVHLLATGGTIAGKASSETATTGYEAGALGVEDLLSALPEGENFVIGGEHMYRTLFPYADTLYITEVHKSCEGDAFFPDFDGKEWHLVSKKAGEGPIPHDFCVYKKMK